ncbi:MAG TPA: ATP-binding protein [Chthoniobacterales bacterium]|jgi:signal transduction histidine kinase|nr:ATP-binding protein [Chthoniobacterales bacterium]
MKRWPLRWKLAVYAAALAVVATLAGATTTWTIMRFWEMKAFDERLALDARELFRDVENFEGGLATNSRAFQEKFVPLALKDRFIEIRGPAGEIIYRSANVPPSGMLDGIENVHTRKIDERSIRMGTYQWNGLTLCVGADMREVNRIGWDILLGMVGAIPTVLIVITIGGRWVARQALAPVEAISHAASRISVDNLDQRLPVPPTEDEIAELIKVMNVTLDRLQRSFEQSVRFSAEASHHLKTPISVLRAGIEEILTDPDTPSKQQTRADALLHQVHQLTSIAENLLLLARSDAGRLVLNREQFDLCEVLRGACEDASVMAEAEGLEVEADLPQELPLVADRRAVSLIVQNLLENAIKYNEPEGCICIYARNVNGEAEVTVKNNGEPIPPERAPHIFERFYRARPDARISGQGLGLSIACELAKAHGGRLELIRSDDEWTEFRLTLAGVVAGARQPEAVLA